MTAILDAPTVPNASRVDVNPALASAWLEGNKGNRPLNTKHVQMLSNAIQAGRFQYNGDTIRISKEGTLLDGQHRLNAVIEADATVPMLVVFGLDEDVVSSIDQGRPRSVIDILRMRGLSVIHHNVVIGTATILAQHTLALEPVASGGRATIADYVEAHAEELTQWAAWGHRVAQESPQIPTQYRSRLRGVSPSPVAALAIHMTRSGADADTVREFFMGAAQGSLMDAEKLATLSPERISVLQSLHRRMLNGQPLSRPNGGGQSTALMGEYYIYTTAFNKFCNNEPMRLAKGIKNPPRVLDELPHISTKTLDL
ncbi:hypothetical protein SEA_ESTES_151 [Mycobacterium phage Estes]|uniref:Helix-turn-helix DNA binding domain protein n=1 Tax=Mycobacterium phage Estes TaxID=2759459 RepID=A0A7G9A2K0_9CAUD|nr:hypothetical protein J4U03_gp124 [Mycobacterium phage Estes]QNL30839.1 hypothetical protein SEA_ESTES_151 [Mycobacterium phage Estes]